MENPQKRGFWERTVEALSFGLAVPEETYAEGSIDSAGGNSPLSGVTPPPRSTGPTLDPRTALGINAVYRAVFLLGTAFGQLPLEIQRSGQSIDAVPLFVKKPHPEHSQSAFFTLTAHNLATHGNAFWRLHRKGTESPVSEVQMLEILNPELVLVETVRGRKVYRYGDAAFADWQVKHLMIFPTFEPGSNRVQGVGPIQANRRELQAILELESYAQNFYRNNGIPTGILTTDSALGQGEADAIRARWYEVAADGGIQVLPNGLSFQAIGLDPEKAMFHASASKAVVDVARMFGIPANYLLAAIDGTAMTYSNMQDVDRTLIRYTLMAYATAIEDAFTELLPRGQRAKFNIDAFLRSDTKSRYEAHKIAIDAGFLTVDEVRALEDLAPINSNEGDAPTN